MSGGKLAKWMWFERQLAKEEKVRVPTWGFNGSPLVLGDRLLLNAGAAGVVDLKTGKTLWKSADGERVMPRGCPCRWAASRMFCKQRPRIRRRTRGRW